MDMFTPQKELGQNFLKNREIIWKMIEELDVQTGDEIIEIGPGLGAITNDLLESHADKEMTIKAIEIDPRFVDKLKMQYRPYHNFEIIESNILDWLPQYKPENPYKIIGSLPYYITSPIIHTIIKMDKLPEVCVLLVQKEVAHKIVAAAPDSSYLSAFIQTFFEINYLTKVDKDDFTPAPKVDGGVISLKKRQGLEDIDIRKYEGFLHKAFSNPRKMLNKVFHQDELNRAQLEGKKRAQNYNWNEWLQAFRILV